MSKESEISKSLEKTNIEQLNDEQREVYKKFLEFKNSYEGIDKLQDKHEIIFQFEKKFNNEYRLHLGDFILGSLLIGSSILEDSESMPFDYYEEGSHKGVIESFIEENFYEQEQLLCVA